MRFDLEKEETIKVKIRVTLYRDDYFDGFSNAANKSLSHVVCYLCSDWLAFTGFEILKFSATAFHFLEIGFGNFIEKILFKVFLKIQL